MANAVTKKAAAADDSIIMLPVTKSKKANKSRRAQAPVEVTADEEALALELFGRPLAGLLDESRKPDREAAADSAEAAGARKRVRGSAPPAAVAAWVDDDDVAVDLSAQANS